MRLIQTDARFSLESVKPLEPLGRYRSKALELTRQALGKSHHRRDRSPVMGRPLEPFGKVDGLEYSLCPDTGSWFLSEVADVPDWSGLLAQLNNLRHGPESFHLELAQSRADHVYAPKLEWIEDTLRFQGIHGARLFEATTAPSPFTRLLQESTAFSEVKPVDEMQLAHDQAQPSLRLGGSGLASSSQDHGKTDGPAGGFQAGVLFESLDRSDDPRALLHGASHLLEKQGLLFVTGLVSSGFDFSVLGLKNLYLYPPDRTNLFSLKGLTELLTRNGFALVEVSTPGVLDLEVVKAHLRHDPSIAISSFESRLAEAEEETQRSFQDFLQQQRLSSFARIVARKME